MAKDSLEAAQGVGGSPASLGYRCFEYLVDHRHSTVLGYTATSRCGGHFWQELDWRGVRTDGGQHLFNPCGGEYLHVRVKYDRELDYWSLADRRWYRVRCRHEIGTSWRGGIVRDIKVFKRGRQWFWQVCVALTELECIG